MIVVDIFIVVFVAFLVVIVGPFAARKLLALNPKRKELEAAQEADELGEVNTVRFNLTELRKCRICGKLTDPMQDLRTTGSWVHYDCYIDQHKDKKNNA